MALIDPKRTLIIKAPTLRMNPTADSEAIQLERERDPDNAAAEYDVIPRSDRKGLVDQELVESVERDEPRELPLMLTLTNGGQIIYKAAADVSGGKVDAAAACVGFRDHEDKVIIAACRRWPSPHDPAKVAGQVAEFLAIYGLNSAIADGYAAEVSKALYRAAGVELLTADVNRSEAYLQMLPLFTGSRIEIPRDPVLRVELLGLERRTGRSGRDSVDHKPFAHDDMANAMALCAQLLGKRTFSTDGQFAAFRSTVNDGLAGLGSDDIDLRRREYDGIIKQPLWPTDIN